MTSDNVSGGKCSSIEKTRMGSWIGSWGSTAQDSRYFGSAIEASDQKPRRAYRPLGGLTALGLVQRPRGVVVCQFLIHQMLTKDRRVGLLQGRSSDNLTVSWVFSEDTSMLFNLILTE